MSSPDYGFLVEDVVIVFILIPMWYYLAGEKKIGLVYSRDISPPETVLIRAKMSELNETRWP